MEACSSDILLSFAMNMTIIVITVDILTLSINTIIIATIIITMTILTVTVLSLLPWQPRVQWIFGLLLHHGLQGAVHAPHRHHQGACHLHQLPEMREELLVGKTP